jgi:hypothetical protein
LNNPWILKHTIKMIFFIYFWKKFQLIFIVNFKETILNLEHFDLREYRAPYSVFPVYSSRLSLQIHSATATIFIFQKYVELERVSRLSGVLSKKNRFFVS